MDIPQPQTFKSLAQDPSNQGQPEPTPKKNKEKAIQFSKEKTEKLEKDILEKFDRWKEGRQITDSQVITNVAYYVGRHYLFFDRTLNRLTPVEIPVQDQTLAVFNRTMPKCRYALARMTNNLPSGQVIPDSLDSEAVQAAQCGEDWLKHSFRTGKVPRTHREVALWSIVGGNAWEKVVWDTSAGMKFVEYEQEPIMEQQVDPTTGQPALHPETQQPLLQQSSHPITGEPLTRPKVNSRGKPVVSDEWNEGKVRRAAVGPLAMYYDQTFTEWDDVPECIERQFKGIDWIKATIPNCDDILDDTAEGVDDAYQMMYNTEVGLNPNALKRCAAVLEYWAKSSDDYPQGVRAIIVGRKIRVAGPAEDDEEEEFTELPYAITKFIEIPGLIRGIGLPEVLLSPQQVYNRVMSQIIDNANDMINIKILEHETTRIADPITDQTGEKVKYSGEKPEYWQPQGLPQTHFQLLTKLEDNFDVISMIHRVAEGQLDASINSGDQVDAITENDKMGNNPIIDNFGEMIAHAAHLELKLVQKYVTDEVMLKVMGQDGKYKLKPFRGSDLKNNTDVAIIPGSMTQESPAAQRRKIEMMLQANVLAQLPPPKQQAFLEEMLKLLNLGNSAKFIQEINTSEDRAEHENEGFYNGVAAYVLPWDDNDIHIEVVERLLNSPEFEAWPKDSKDLAIQHWQDHLQKKQQIIQQQQMAGGPPGAPSPDGPPGNGPHAPPIRTKPEATPNIKQQMATAAAPVGS